MPHRICGIGAEGKLGTVNDLITELPYLGTSDGKGKIGWTFLCKPKATDPE
jgi:hypothetical protein